MADNIVIRGKAGTQEKSAADDIDGVKYQRVKLVQGEDGVNEGDVSVDSPLHVTILTSDVIEIITQLKITNIHLSKIYGLDIHADDIIQERIVMGFHIADGKGRGNLAEVNNENELVVRSVG